MLFYWFSWLAIIFIIFLSSFKKNLNRFILFSLLFNVIFINAQIEIGQFSLTIPYLYCLITFWVTMIMKRTDYFDYYLALCLSMMYVGFRSIFIVSPIWLLLNEYLLITLLFSLIIIAFIRRNQDQILILVTSCLTGEWIFAVSVQKLDWSIMIGDAKLITSLYLGILLLLILNRGLLKYKLI